MTEPGPPRGTAPKFVEVESSQLWSAYLTRVRALTKALAASQRQDIEAEVRAHLLESMLDGSGSESERLQSAQQRLGEPEDYVPGWVAERLSFSADPALVLRSRWQLMRLDFARGFVGLLRSCAFGFGHMLVFYSFALVILKLIYPENVGLFELPNGFPMLGFVDVAGAKEYLGWALVPLLLVIGSALFWAMNRTAPTRPRQSGN